jgi:hypothetical protein
MGKRPPLWGSIKYPYIQTDGVRSCSSCKLRYTPPSRTPASMDTNARGIMYIHMRRYGGIFNAVRKYTHGGKYHIQKYHHGDYPHGST